MLDVKLTVVGRKFISVGFGYHECSELETAVQEQSWLAIIANVSVGITMRFTFINLPDILESIDPGTKKISQR